MKQKKLYIKVGGTYLNVSKMDSLKDSLPTYQEIVGHILAEYEAGIKEHTPIQVKFKPEKMLEVRKEIKQKTGNKLAPWEFTVFLDQERHPVINLSTLNDDA